MRASTAIVVALAAACTAPSSNVSGTIGGVSFRATNASFGPTLTLEPTAPRTTLSFHDFAYCAVAADPSKWPTLVNEVAIDFANPLAAGTFALGTNDAPGSGIDGVATGMWRTGNYAGNFTGGTITVTSASANEIEGTLEVTSPNGDYAAGSFRAASCATAGAL